MISLQDLATHLQLSRSTISLALSGKGTISKATRDRVRAAAHKLGYRPNPLLQAAGRRRLSTQAGTRDFVPVAFLHQVPARARNHFVDSGLHHSQLHGIEVRAFDIAGRNLKQLGQSLYHQGYGGIILGPITRSMEGFPFEHFSVVRLGGRAPEDGRCEAFDQIAAGPFQGVLFAWQRALAAGYQRVGLGPVHHTEVEIYDDLARRGAALLMNESTSRRNRVPPCEAVISDRAGYLDWVRKVEPEVIIGLNDNYAHELIVKGWKIPGDIAFVSLHVTVGYYVNATGFRDDTARMLDTACRHLADLISRQAQEESSEGGIILRVHEQWVEGGTLPRKTRG